MALVNDLYLPSPLLTKEGKRREYLYLPTFPSSEKVPVLTKEGNTERMTIFSLPFVRGG